MSRIPSFNRKVRVVVDWSLAFFLKREVVALAQLHDPREEFIEASQPVGAGRA
jgi:NADH dehydrogenase